MIDEATIVKEIPYANGIAVAVARSGLNFQSEDLKGSAMLGLVEAGQGRAYQQHQADGQAKTTQKARLIARPEDADRTRPDVCSAQFPLNGGLRFLHLQSGLARGSEPFELTLGQIFSGFVEGVLDLECET